MNGHYPQTIDHMRATLSTAKGVTSFAVAARDGMLVAIVNTTNGTQFRRFAYKSEVCTGTPKHTNTIIDIQEYLNNVAWILNNDSQRYINLKRVIDSRLKVDNAFSFVEYNTAYIIINDYLYTFEVKSEYPVNMNMDIDLISDIARSLYKVRESAVAVKDKQLVIISTDIHSHSSIKTFDWHSEDTGTNEHKLLFDEIKTHLTNAKEINVTCQESKESNIRFIVKSFDVGLDNNISHYEHCIKDEILYLIINNRLYTMSIKEL